MFDNLLARIEHHHHHPAPPPVEQPPSSKPSEYDHQQQRRNVWCNYVFKRMFDFGHTQIAGFTVQDAIREANTVLETFDKQFPKPSSCCCGDDYTYEINEEWTSHGCPDLADKLSTLEQIRQSKDEGESDERS
jgi:hypothetical protein